MTDKPKVYIAGPMESVGGNWNENLFDDVTERLRKAGCFVFSPAEHARKSFGSIQNMQAMEKVARGAARRSLFVGELTFIIEEADFVLMLPGWEKSPGASAEHAVALAVGKEIRLAPDIIIPGHGDDKAFDFAAVA